MDCNNLILFNFNAYRATSVDRLMELRIMFEKFDPDIISIQEIHIRNSLICFSDQYHVIVNIDKSSKDGIGIITLVKKKVILKSTLSNTLPFENFFKKTHSKLPLPSQDQSHSSAILENISPEYVVFLGDLQTLNLVQL